MDRKHAEAKELSEKQQSQIFGAGIVALAAFIFIAMDVRNNGMILHIDALINSEMPALQNQAYDGAIVLITHALSPTVFIALSIVSAAIIYRKERGTAFFIAATMGGGAFIGYALKYLFHRLRPDNGLIEATNYSFPSGHALTATIFFSLMIYIFGMKIKNKVQKYAFVAVNLSLMILAGLSRLYLNVHWLSDVVAGFMLGLSWIFFAIYFKRKCGQKYFDRISCSGSQSLKKDNY